MSILSDTYKIPLDTPNQLLAEGFIRDSWLSNQYRNHFWVPGINNITVILHEGPEKGQTLIDAIWLLDNLWERFEIQGIKSVERLKFFVERSVTSHTIP